ncbi:hypothetical protein ACFWM0_31810 [Streptomyces sp. NPDC058405]|uniref:hypothetical protein n=1 Tax=Streptomyces sp. NPDC058405 TaxID=3346482 RepID=UPI003646D6F5
MLLAQEVSRLFLAEAHNFVGMECPALRDGQLIDRIGDGQSPDGRLREVVVVIRSIGEQQGG